MDLFKHFLIIALVALSCTQNRDTKHFTLKEEKKAHLIFATNQEATKLVVPTKADHYTRVTVTQCGFDVVVRAPLNHREPSIIDSPTGSFSKEVFLLPHGAENGANIYISGNEIGKKHGYAEVAFEFLKPTPDHHQFFQAQQYYFGAYQSRNAADLEAQKQALALYQKAAAIFNTDSHGYHKMVAYGEIAQIQASLNRYDLALSAAFQALALAERLNEISWIAFYYNDIASYYSEKQAFETALNFLHRSVSYWLKLSPKSSLSATYGNISVQHAFLGNALLEKYFLELQLESLIQPYNNGGISINANLGRYYFRHGHYRRSNQAYERAIEIAKITGNEHTLIGIFSKVNLANNYRRLGEIDRAEALGTEALRLAIAYNQDRAVSACQFHLGHIYLAKGQFQLAQDYFQKAMATIPSRRKDDLLLSMAIGNYQHAMKLVEPMEKEQLLHQSLEHVNASLGLDMEPWVQARAFFWKAKILLELEPTKTLETLEAGIAVIERVRLATSSPNEKTGFFSTKLHFYQLLVDLQVEEMLQDQTPQTTSDLFLATQKLKARTLLDIALEQPIQPPGLASRQEVQEFQQIVASMEEGFDQPLIVEQLENQLQTIEPKIARLQKSKTLPQAPPVETLEAVQNALEDSQTLLLSYVYGLEQAYLLALDKSQVFVRDLGDQNALNQAAQTVHRYVRTHPLNRDPLKKEAYERARQFLGNTYLQLGDQLANYKRLVFIPQGMLHTVPFASLPYQHHRNQKATRLGNAFDIAILPSSSVWLALKKRRTTYQPPPNRPALGIVANPIFQLQTTSAGSTRDQPSEATIFPQLHGTQREADKMASLVADAFVASKFNAKRDLVTSGRFQNVQYLHFATHGVINHENPHQSYLLLSRFNEQGQPLNGKLTLSDIQTLKLHADLVSLSACETASGKMIAGEGLISLANGFMAAGVPSVLGTLWKVSDDATVELMTDVYRGILQEKLKPADALRKAQFRQQNRSEWQDPYFWSGFVLIGDWQ